MSWFPAAVFRGARLIRKLDIDIIWSTYPIATAHLIGWALHRLTGRPWVADFRDSMTEEAYPADPQIRRAYRWIERHTVARAAGVAFTTPGTKSMYARRYPQVPPERWVVVPNGYDEGAFRDAEARLPATRLQHSGEAVLVHSGVLYPSERDPTRFLEALAMLKAKGVLQRRSLRVILRATGHDATIARLIERFDVGDLVQLAPAVGYRDALMEMMMADGLLLLQAANCNHQIPAKLYEYLRARRPILGLTDPAGDTAQTLRSVGIDSIAPLDDARQIAELLKEFLDRKGDRKFLGDQPALVMQYSRAEQTVELAGLLDEVAKRA